MRAGDIAMEKGCDQACHEHNLCNLVLTQFGDTKICDELVAAYRATLSFTWKKRIYLYLAS